LSVVHPVIYRCVVRRAILRKLVLGVKPKQKVKKAVRNIESAAKGAALSTSSRSVIRFLD
jgi:hypothetical protein